MRKGKMRKGEYISFLTMVPINKNESFWEKNYQTFLWQLMFKEWKGTRTGRFSYENYIIRILTFCAFLTSCPQFFLTEVYVFYRKKKRLSFTYYNVKIYLLPFKSPMFSEILVAKKHTDTFLE